MNDVIAILNSTLRLTTPVAYVTLAAIISEKSGINALAMEGIMLMGSFGAVLGSYLTGSAWLGVVFGMLFSAALSLLRGVLSITYQANQTVAGVGANIFASGLTAILLKIIWGMDGKSGLVNSLDAWHIPLLRDIPVLGRVLGEQNPLVYLFYPCLAGLYILLYKTRFGLRVTVAGEKPYALSALGMSVARYRYLSLLISGLLAGLGGAYLSIGQLSFFSVDMTAGRGFMAMAACIFGGWNPIGGFLGSLVFGFAETMQMRLQTTVQYTQFIQMIPYALTLLVLAGIGRRKSGAPAANGVPYKEQQ